MPRKKTTSAKKVPGAPLSLNDALKSKKPVYVLFYANWCGHSQKFLPFFEKHVQGEGLDCVRVVLEDEEELFDHHSVNIMPSLLVFKDGKLLRRLDGTPGMGLNEKQLTDLIASCRR